MTNDHPNKFLPNDRSNKRSRTKLRSKHLETDAARGAYIKNLSCPGNYKSQIPNSKQWGVLRTDLNAFGDILPFSGSISLFGKSIFK
jgi:hypothetical protein